MKKRTIIGIIVIGVVVVCTGPVMIAGAFIWGLVDAAREDAKEYPGKKEFRAENAKIDIFEEKTGFGDTPTALQTAKTFSKDMEDIHREFFKGGSALNLDPTSHFVSYCRISPGQVIIICHVPDMQGYHDEVLQTLEKTAWIFAQADAITATGGKTGKLVLGLRGFATYASVQEGGLTGLPTAKDETLHPEIKLYPYFVAPGD